MRDLHRLVDRSFRGTLVEALDRAGELLIVICWAQAAGRKSWYLVRDECDLRTALEAFPERGRWGYSDRIEAYATGELPDRSTSQDASREAALRVIRECGEVVLACRLDADPELHDVEATDRPADVDDWFRDQHQGELLVGPHPFRHDRDPDAAVLVAWNHGSDGSVRPGAY